MVQRYNNFFEIKQDCLKVFAIACDFFKSQHKIQAEDKAGMGGEEVVASAIAHPPRVAAPEKAVVGRDGTIEIESRGEIGEVHAVVEVERRNDLATHIEPLAEGQAAPNQGAPIGAIGTCVEVDTGIDMR